jgi:hypothetical protein
LFRNQIISLGWNEWKISENKWATTSSIHILLTSSFYHSTLPLSEQMKHREKWRLIIQEAKAHLEL